MKDVSGNLSVWPLYHKPLFRVLTFSNTFASQNTNYESMVES